MITSRREATNVLNIIIVVSIVAVVCLGGVFLVTKGNFIGEVILKLKLGKIFEFEVNVNKNKKTEDTSNIKGS